MKKLKEIWPKGLAGKLVSFVVIFAFVLGIIFFVMSNIQVYQLRRAVRNEGEKSSDLIEGEYSHSMEEINRETLLQLSIWAADKTDDEFWIISHDLKSLGIQVADVYRHPENYGRTKVYEPKKENAGKFVLQILYPGDPHETDPSTTDMVERLANLSPMMERMVSDNEGYTLDLYIATMDDVTLAMDSLSDGKYDEEGKLKEYIPSSRPWFQGAVSTKDMYISSAVHSFFYDMNEVVYGYPVIVDGEIVAVLEASTALGVIEKKMAERNVGEEGFSILVSSGGQLVCSQRTDGELRMREDLSEDIRGSVNSTISQVINDALTGESNVEQVTVDGKEYLAAYAPLNTVGWTQITFASVEELSGPTNILLETMEKSNEDMLRALSRDFRIHVILLVIGLVVILQAAIIIVSLLAQRRVRPIQKMTESVMAFVGDDMDFEMSDVYRTGDEIQELAESFDVMSRRMKEYVAEIIENTAERERAQAEMEAASQIQYKMLPTIETEFHDKPGYELYAKMETAREVGGDLYDFYYLDDDHLVITIGDVSGKGITAALFMALSKQMLKAQMMIHDGDLKEAMNEANKRLCEESADAMFVTVWIGVLTLSTGVLQFVNAGHMYAAVKSGDNGFEIKEDDHCMLMGGLDFISYKVNTTTLKKGDVVYLYTDGVTEAHNNEDELFGDARFIAALDEDSDAPLEDLDNKVRLRVKEFADGAEQYDDITTVCFRYIGI